MQPGWSGWRQGGRDGFRMEKVALTQRDDEIFTGRSRIRNEPRGRYWTKEAADGAARQEERGSPQRRLVGGV